MREEANPKLVTLLSKTEETQDAVLPRAISEQLLRPHSVKAMGGQ